MSRGTVGYIAKTSLPHEKLCVPFMWCVFESSINIGVTTWTKVTHIVPTWKQLDNTKYRNVFFVINNTHGKNIKDNCCFPGFLSSEYKRTCGSAFEGLNKTMPITVPDEPLVLGFMTNTKNEGNDLCGTITVRLNGKQEITLSKLR